MECSCVFIVCVGSLPEIAPDLIINVEIVKSASICVITEVTHIIVRGAGKCGIALKWQIFLQCKLFGVSAAIDAALPHSAIPILVWQAYSRPVALMMSTADRRRAPQHSGGDHDKLQIDEQQVPSDPVTLR